MTSTRTILVLLCLASLAASSRPEPAHAGGLASSTVDIRGGSSTTGAGSTRSAASALTKGAAVQGVCGCNGLLSNLQEFTSVYLGPPPTFTNPAQIGLPKFDPQLGVLRQVEYRVQVELPSASSGFENTNLISECLVGSMVFQLRILVSDPLGAEMFPTGADFDCSQGSLNIPLNTFDGQVDFAGSSGITLTCSPPPPPPETSKVTSLCSDQQPLTGFIGAGQSVVFLVRSILNQAVDTTCNNLDSMTAAQVEVSVTIRYTYCVETGPPVCPTGVSVNLWPPNHQYVDLDLAAVTGVTDPANLPLSFQITDITQDEPVDAQGGGDGHTVCDGTGVGTAIARIRAERQGGGNGRVYAVHYTATNSAGFSCLGSFSVRVPHSQNGQPAVDSGQLHESGEDCP